MALISVPYLGLAVKLTLEADKTSMGVNDQVKLSGYLKAGPLPLANKEIRFVMTTPVQWWFWTEHTDGNGYFERQTGLGPYPYVGPQAGTYTIHVEGIVRDGVIFSMMAKSSNVSVVVS